MDCNDTRFIAIPTYRSSTLLNDKDVKIDSKRLVSINFESSFKRLNSSSSIDWPSLILSLRDCCSCFCKKVRILFRACPLLTILIQSALGPTELLLVKISTTSPVFNGVFKGTIAPLTLAPTVLLPTSVWILYAKSIGQEPVGNAITLPLGVKQYTLASKISFWSTFIYSSGSSLSSSVIIEKSLNQESLSSISFCSYSGA